MKASFEGFDKLSVAEQIIVLKDLEKRTKQSQANATLAERDIINENYNPNNNKSSIDESKSKSQKDQHSSSSSSSFSQTQQAYIKNEYIPALPTDVEIISCIKMDDYPGLVLLVKALCHPDEEEYRQIIDSARQALCLKQENRANKTKISDRSIIDDEDEETNTNKEKAVVVQHAQLIVKKQVEQFVMVIIMNIFFISSIIIILINQVYSQHSMCFDKTNPFTGPAPLSSSNISIQSYKDRNAHISEQLFDLFHAGSPYYDDRDTEKKGQYKEMEVVLDKHEEEEKSPKKVRKLGLKEAMEKASSSSSSTEESTSLKKNGGGGGASQLDDNSNCILSQEGNC